MFVLGLDPSLTDTGWSKLWMDPDGTAELADSGRIRTSSDQPDTIRYLTQRDELRELISDPDLDAVSTEQPPPSASYSAGLYPMFIYVKTWALYNRLDVAQFTPSVLQADVRRRLGKSGRSTSKKDMVEAACMILDEHEHRPNHNIADSVHAGYKGGRLFQLIYGEITDDDLTKRERKSFLKIVNHRDGTRTLKGDIYKEGDDRHSTYTRFTSPKYDYLY